MRFENKNVLVTSATGGIGRETCFQFASEGAAAGKRLDSETRAAITLCFDVKSGFR